MSGCILLDFYYGSGVISHWPSPHLLTLGFFTREFSSLLDLPKLKKLQVRFWPGMAASMVACYSMVAANVAAVLVKKPVMVGKVLSVTTSLTAKESSAVEQIWQDWREGHL